MSESNIPKLIHNIYYDFPSDVDLDALANRINMEQNNKNYTFFIWDKCKIQDLVSEFGLGKHLEYFYNQQTTKSQKLKFSKLVILYCFGGIILDNDIFLEGSVDNYIDANYDLILTPCMSTGFLDWMFPQVTLVSDRIIMSKPKHPIVLNMLVQMSGVGSITNELLLPYKLLLSDTTGTAPGIPNNYMITDDYVEDISFLEKVLQEVKDRDLVPFLMMTSVVVTSVVSASFLF